MSECVFCKIIAGELPTGRVMEDEDMIVFHDIWPVAPVHMLVVPKRHIVSLAECDEKDAALLGKLMVTAKKAAEHAGLTDGFRTIVNTGKVGGQEVFHLHVHVLGGEEPLGRLVGE